LERHIKFSIFGLFIFLTSCYSEDFLKDELLSDTSIDFLYSSEEGISNAVVGLYSINREPYERDWFNGAIPLILTAKSDNEPRHLCDLAKLIGRVQDAEHL